MPTDSPSLHARVKAQYEAFPYPHYPLLVPLRTQEAYASHSLFAARLLDQRGLAAAVRREAAPRVLLAGCGDIFPSMASHWEPRAHRITALDLSAASLRRARLRCLPRLRAIDWRLGNLEDPGIDLPEALSHVDCYGVLHHLANPARALRSLADRLLPGGTARLMVYNSEARGWIRHLQRAFALLGLSAHHPGDVVRAKRLLDLIAGQSTILRARLAPMGDSLSNPARLVDTFLHAREARLGLRYWLQALEGAGLAVLGLYDRYGELDDLRNPLLEAPSLADWEERIVDRRFENNLELYVAKPGAARTLDSLPAPRPRLFDSPVRSWFDYEETRSLSYVQRRRLWARFLGGLAGRRLPADDWAGHFPPGTLQRLARLGALFPDDFRSQELKALLFAPIHDSMEPPEFPAPSTLSLRSEVETILRGKSASPRKLGAVLRRLDAAQKP